MELAVGDRVFEALADGTRRALVEKLSAGERSATSLADGFPVTRSRVSQHMRVLKEAGLVSERRDGRFRYYCLKPARLDAVVEWLRKQQERFWSERLTALGDELDGEGEGE